MNRTIKIQHRVPAWQEYFIIIYPAQEGYYSDRIRLYGDPNKFDIYELQDSISGEPIQCELLDYYSCPYTAISNMVTFAVYGYESKRFARVLLKRYGSTLINNPEVDVLLLHKIKGE